MHVFGLVVSDGGSLISADPIFLSTCDVTHPMGHCHLCANCKQIVTAEKCLQEWRISIFTMLHTEERGLMDRCKISVARIVVKCFQMKII